MAPQGERKRPGPKPGFKRAAAAVVATVAVTPVVADPVTQAPPIEVQQTRFPNPLQRHRDIDSMGEAELRSYARQLGLTPRDAETLSVERLRANCRAQVYALIEDL